MAGLTNTGFDIKSLELLLDEINTQMKANIDANLNTESDSVAGQITGIVSTKLREIWELALAVWQGASPDTASGQSLSYLAQLTGTTRLPASKATVSTYLILGSAVAVPVDSAVTVENDPNSRFELTAGHTQTVTQTLGNYTYDDTAGTPNSNGEAEPNTNLPSTTTSVVWRETDEGATDRSAAFGALTIGDYIGVRVGTNVWVWRTTSVPSAGAGNVTIQVEYVGGDDPAFPATTAATSQDSDVVILSATEAGSYPVAASTDTAVIATPVTGWQEALFIIDSADGTDEETDAALRIRRIIELSAPGSATVNAMRADLLDEAAVLLSNVVSANIFENATGLTDANGLPPYSVEVLVTDDGVTLVDEPVMAQQIFDAKPAGTQTYGSLSDTATDDGGNDHTVYFSKPAEIRTYIDLTMSVDTLVYTAGTAEAALEAWGDNLVLGQDVYASDVINVVADLAGVISVSPATVMVDFETPPTTTDLIISARQLATIAQVDVDVTLS